MQQLRSRCSVDTLTFVLRQTTEMIMNTVLEYNQAPECIKIPGISCHLGLISDADVFAYYAETRFDILFRHYARGFWHIIPVLCRKFLKRRASRADLLACLRYVSVEPVIQRTSIGILYYFGRDGDAMTTMTRKASHHYWNSLQFG